MAAFATMQSGSVARAPQSRVQCRHRSSALRGTGESFRTGNTVFTAARISQQQRQPARQVTRMGLFGLGVPELALVAGAAALLFGPAKIPELGQALGKTAKSVKAAANEFQKELQSDDAEGDSLSSPASGNQKLKEKDPKAGEGEGVQSIE